MRLYIFLMLVFVSLSEWALAGSWYTIESWRRRKAEMELTLMNCSNGDNCLNAMKNRLSSASAFCTPYLATTQTVTNGIPSFLAGCKASTSRLSSACSCILVSTANTATPPTTSTTLNTQLSCTATTTITALASTVTTTVTSGSTCPSTGPPNTLTSVSISTTTVTVTATALPSCFPHIIGGSFTSSSQNLAAFTVTQNPPETIFNEVIASSAENLLSVTDGTPQFLLLNYELLPIASSYTLSQDIGTLCNPYTSITLSATINASSGDGTVTFCINPTTCSSPQDVLASNGKFVEYSASFVVPAEAAITASLDLAVNDFAPEYFAGIGTFQVSPS